MNIAQLKTLVAVVEEGSFSRAARKMGVSQPGATMQIQSLEAELGQSLLLRYHRGIELTEAGRLFMPFALKTIENYTQTCSLIDSLKVEASGPLHLALSTTPGDYIVPGLLADFLKLYPNIIPSLSVTSSRDAIEKVEDRSADLAFVGISSDEAQLDFIECGIDELILIAHPEHELAQKILSFEDLSQQRWVRRLEDSGTQKVISDFFAARKLDDSEFDYVVEFGTGEAIVNAVEGNLGVAIVSRHVAKRSLDAAKVIELKFEGLPLKRPFYLALPKQGLSRSAEVFKDYLLERMKADDEQH